MRLIKDTKVIGSEECVSQHKLLVCDIVLQTRHPRPRVMPRRRKIWKLKDPITSREFEQIVTPSLYNPALNMSDDVDVHWNTIKTSLLTASESICGWTRGGAQTQRETWWWDSTVESAITEKRRLWKVWQHGGDKEPYLAAKRNAKSAVYAAKNRAQKENLSNLERKDGKNYVFKLAKKLKHENQDVVSENCVRDDSGNLAFSEEARLDAWKCHYNRLLNIEFPWDADSLATTNPVQGPALQITEAMVSSAMSAMKNGKAAGPSEVVIEMVRAAGPAGVSSITALSNQIVFQNKIPDDWNLSHIINCYKGKGDALERGNYRGLKMLDQVLKIVERVLEQIIREQVSIDSMQFGFMPGKGTTDAIFILRQLHEKYISKKKDIFFIFVDLEKAFDRVPRQVLWWAMRKLGVQEWVISVVKSMYENARSKVRLGSDLSEEFNVKVGVHQGSVLSPLLFAIVMEAVSREFRHGCPWELLYADDLVIAADTIEELKERFLCWKSNLEAKGLKVNIGKTKVLCSNGDASPQHVEKSKFPCGVCGQGVGANSIFCNSCQHWIHKRCSGLATRLKDDPNFKCKRCTGELESAPPPAITEIEIAGDTFDVVESFCYLGDVTDRTGGCFAATTARVRGAWKSFRELLPVLTNKGISLCRRGKIHQQCVREVLLHASETWPAKTDDIARLVRSDNAMVRWICSVRLSERRSMAELRQLLGIEDIPSLLQFNRLRWFGHVERMPSYEWPKKIQADFEIDGPTPRGGQRKRWIHNVRSDLGLLRLDASLAQDRDAWRQQIRHRRHDPGGVQPPELGNHGQ